MRDTRIPVELTLHLLGPGYTAERIIGAYPALTLEDIRGATSFAASRVGKPEANREYLGWL